MACAQQHQRAAEQVSREGALTQTLKQVARSQEAQTRAQRHSRKGARSASSSSDGSGGRRDGDFDATFTLPSTTSRFVSAPRAWFISQCITS